MSDPTAYYLFQRGLLHKRNAEKMLASPDLNGREIVSELMSMVKFMEMGVQKQKREIDEQLDSIRD